MGVMPAILYPLIVILILGGMALIAYGLGLNRRRAPHYRPTRFGLMGAGAILVLAGVVVSLTIG